MKRIVKTAALALAAACLLASLTGCLEQKKTDAELIVGRWETAFDVSGTVKSAVTERDGSFADADFTGLGLPYQIAFTEDGTYTAGIPADGTERLLRDAAGRMAPVMKERVRRELAEAQQAAPEEISDERLDGYVGMIGYGTWEDMCLDLLQSMLFSMDVDGMFAAETVSGRYMLAEGRLFLSDGPEIAADTQSRSAAFRVDENTLTLSSGDDALLPPFGAFPAGFTRIASDGND